MTTFGKLHDVTPEFYFEWQIDDFFSLPEKDGGRCLSPSFSFAGESWYFTLVPNGASTTNSVGYIGAYLDRKSCGPPITVAWSLRLKSFEGKKYEEMHFTEVFEKVTVGWGSPKLLKRSVLSEKKSELAPSDVLTLVCHIEYYSKSSVGAGDTEVAKCSHCKNTFGAEYLSSHEQKCLDKPIRCPTCGNIVVLRKWIDHECDTARIKEKEKEKTSPEVNDIKDDVSDVPGSNESEVSCYNETSTIEWEEKLVGNADLEENYENLPAGPSSQIQEETGIGSLNQDFKEVFLNGNISDVVLKVKNQESSAHKCILATRSPTFMTVILHDTEEKVTHVVDIQDVDRDIFANFINYLYTRRVENLTSQSALKLYKIAHKYQITELKETCLQHMLTNISIDNFCDAYMLSLRHHEVDLEKACFQFFAQNSFDIILTAKWQSFLCENPVIGNELFIKHMQLNK